ncbi:MAG: hypothetical protein RBT69_06245 [Spirochaetia bacterium]|jgi:HEAT repeat protein|nr:hypothetical protein [Spirochaetia bacterium]
MRKENTMKKISALIVLISIGALVYGNENAAMWTRLYNRLDTIEYKLTIMRSIAEQEGRELIPVILQSLTETNSARSSISEITEKRIYNQLQKTSIKKLGELKALEAEEEIYNALVNSEDLIIKGEAITALGRVGSTKYIAELNLMLRNINMRLYSNKNARENETLAYALVTAFEKLQSEETYESVFYASSGWYSPLSGVRERAKEALKIIASDPSEILAGIMKKDSDFKNKYLALEAENNSSAPDEKKGVFASAALDEGITNKPGNIIEQTDLSNIRLLACSMIASSSVKPPEAVPYLKEMIFSNYDINEKLTAISTLGTYKSDEAVAALSSFLRDQNNRKSAGMTQTIDRRAVIAVINALGNTENRAALEEIMVVNTIDWSTAVLKAAQGAAEKLK